MIAKRLERFSMEPYCHKNHLKVYAFINGKRIIFSTGMKLEGVKNGLKGAKLRPYMRPLHITIYEQKRTEISNAVTELLYRGQEINRAQIEKICNPVRNRLLIDLEEFVEKRKKEVQPVTIRTAWIPLLKHLTEFAPEEYNPKVHQAFYNYLAQDTNLADNTIGKYFKRMKQFLRETYPYQSWDFIEIFDKPKSIFHHNIEELSAIMGSYPACKARDLYLVMCLTGLRYSDSQLVTSRMIEGDFLMYSQKKTASIAKAPLDEFILGIFDKYGGRLPKISNQALNRQLKQMCRELKFERLVEVITYSQKKKMVDLVPLWTQVASHTGRKTFCTLLIESGVPAEHAMVMSGHRQYATFKKCYMGDLSASLAKARDHFRVNTQRLR